MDINKLKQDRRKHKFKLLMYLILFWVASSSTVIFNIDPLGVVFGVIIAFIIMFMAVQAQCIEDINKSIKEENSNVK